MAAFYLDHNVAREIAEHLRQLDHTAHTAHQLEMDRAGDEAHLALAARSGWTLVTHNAGDFRLLHAAWQLWGREWGVERHHAGILILFPPVVPLHAAQEIGALLRAEPVIVGSLWTWRRSEGWSRR